MLYYFLNFLFFKLILSQPGPPGGGGSSCNSNALGISSISWASSDASTVSEYIQKLFPSISEESNDNNMQPPMMGPKSKKLNKHHTYTETKEGGYIEDALPPLNGNNGEPGPSNSGSTCTSTTKTLQFSNSCFEMSSIQVSSLSDSELSIETLESTFDTKWSAISDATSSDDVMYDNFLDYNVKFYTDELDTFYESWSTLDDVDTLVLKWTLNGDNYYSVIAHIPSSQINIELIGQSPTFDGYSTDDFVMVCCEPRTTSKTLKKIGEKIKASAGEDNSVYPIGISRAVSDLETSAKYYRKILSYHTLAKDTWYYNTEDGDCSDDDCISDYYTKYQHMQLPIGGAEISLYEKSDTYFSTNGDYTVSTLETALLSGHTSDMTCPYCGMHQYMLNNYQISGVSSSKTSSYGASVLNKIMKLSSKKSSDYLYAVYKNSGHFDMMAHGFTYNYYLFLVEPNGQSSMIYFSPSDFTFKSTPKTYSTSSLCSLSCTTTESNTYISKGIVFGKTIGTWAEKIIPSYVWIIVALSVTALTVTVWLAYTRCCNFCRSYKEAPMPERFIDIKTKYGSTYSQISNETDTDDEPLLSN